MLIFAAVVLILVGVGLLITVVHEKLLVSRSLQSTDEEERADAERMVESKGGAEVLGRRYQIMALVSVFLILTGLVAWLSEKGYFVGPAWTLLMFLAGSALKVLGAGLHFIITHPEHPAFSIIAEETEEDAEETEEDAEETEEDAEETEEDAEETEEDAEETEEDAEETEEDALKELRHFTVAIILLAALLMIVAFSIHMRSFSL